VTGIGKGTKKKKKTSGFKNLHPATTKKRPDQQLGDTKSKTRVRLHSTGSGKTVKDISYSAGMAGRKTGQKGGNGKKQKPSEDDWEREKVKSVKRREMNKKMFRGHTTKPKRVETVRFQKKANDTMC